MTTIITYITTPGLSIILANYNTIMTAYSNLVNELDLYNTYGTSIPAYELAKFSITAKENKNKDITYYNEHVNKLINTVTLLDDYLNDLYYNISSISSNSPIIQEIDALENVLNEINTYYSTNPYFGLFSIANDNGTTLDQMLFFNLSGLDSIIKEGIKVDGKFNSAIHLTAYVSCNQQTIGGYYTCINVTQLTKNNTPVNFYMILEDQVNDLLNDLNRMISTLETSAMQLATNTDLSVIIQKLSNATIVVDGETSSLAQISEYIQSIEGTIS
jgi:hypothetical protein